MGLAASLILVWLLNTIGVYYESGMATDNYKLKLHFKFIYNFMLRKSFTLEDIIVSV